MPICTSTTTGQGVHSVCACALVGGLIEDWHKVDVASIQLPRHYSQCLVFKLLQVTRGWVSDAGDDMFLN
jgi:hypothetical protein